MSGPDETERRVGASGASEGSGRSPDSTDAGSEGEGTRLEVTPRYLEPDELVVALDPARRHRVRIRRGDAGTRVATLEHPERGRRSPLHEALRAHLRLEHEHRVHRFVEPDDRVTLAPAAAPLRVIVGDGAHPLGEVDLRTGRVSASTMSAYETRYLAENGRPHVAAAPAFTPRTDLHTHLAGAVRAEALIAIGVALDLPYPEDAAALAGIHRDPGAPVGLAQLEPAPLEKLTASLAIPLDRKITFLELERVYRLRAPITRAAAAFLPMCRSVARDLAAHGVEYAELSFASILAREHLALAHAGLPEIERETGVTLRFLAALSRHDDPEWDLDMIDRIVELAPSRYLAGVDFMGHETNSTRAFADLIGTAARRAGEVRPGFVIRVHAGENPAYPENVRTAVEACAGAAARLRIGHGLYGVDGRTLELLRRERVMVEFNLNSNFALNNLQSAKDAPLARYLDAGVAVVLGTDGHGMYQTSGPLEARVAGLTGTGAAGFDAIRATEADYLERVDRTSSNFEVPDDRPPRHWTPAVGERRRAADAARRAALHGRLDAIGAPCVPAEDLPRRFENHRWVSIAGAWKRSWDAMGEGSRAAVEREVAALVDGLAGRRVVLVTGGTSYGVEHRVQQLAKGRGVPVVAALVEHSPPGALEPGAFACACVVGRTLHAKAAGLYELMREREGLCLFIGGGNIVSDEIQAAANLRLRYLLMDGVEGASAAHARQQPDRAFRVAADVLAELDRRAKRLAPFWHPGPNPTCDVVLVRRAPGGDRREVLLIRRDVDAAAEDGKWALPGGFRRSAGPQGQPWVEGAETARDAALRELREETGLDVSACADRLIDVAEVRRPGRDPRDTDTAWSVTTVFALELPPELARGTLTGGDDACDARWWPLEPPPHDLAFDHDQLVAEAVRVLNARSTS